MSRATGIPRPTVRDWMRGKLPASHSRSTVDACTVCGSAAHDPGRLPPSYPYLLGLYLGDGCISLHPRGVSRLRVNLDVKYPSIIDECKQAIADLLPRNRIHCQYRRGNYTDSDELTNVVVSAYSKSWPCLIPQHGRGPKHRRSIVLERWQEDLIAVAPGRFLRGLIHSDGCRFINTGRNWSHPRYSFSNQSDDIRGMFVEACGMLGLRCTHAPHTVYVSRKADVAILDEHVGPKE